MAITKKIYGEIDGEKVYAYTLDNGNGLSAEILNLGGIINRLEFMGTDVVLGHNSLDDYMRNDACLGAIIGRNSNRIENAEFMMNGKVYKLNANNGKHNLHGGNKGFNALIWEAKEIDGTEPALELYLISPDGDEGFPGTVAIKVTYTLTSNNGLRIHYDGVSISDTVMNLTNHTYFNLNGHDSGVIDNHTLWLDTDFYTPATAECVTTGEVLSVKGTVFDFKENMTIGERFKMGHPQLDLFGGFDNNLVLNGRGFRKAGVLSGDKTGIVMDMYTDLPAVQVYTSNSLDTERIYKDGAKYLTHGAICLETQVFPNSLKFSHFPTAFLKKGQQYETVTEYVFKK